MDPLYDFLRLPGMIARFIGLFVFGVGAGWFTLFAFRQPEKRWQLQIAVFLGFFFLFAILIRFASPSSIGALALGSGGALLYWGLWSERDKDSDHDIENE